MCRFQVQKYIPWHDTFCTVAVHFVSCHGKMFEHDLKYYKIDRIDVLCMNDSQGVGGCKPPPMWFGITYPEQLGRIDVLHD